MLLERLIELSRDKHASDFLLKEGDPIWVRSSGKLRKVDELRIGRDDLVALVKHAESYSGVKSAKLQEALSASGDVDLAVKLGDRRYRANIYWSNGQRLTAALRQLPDKAPTLSSLGLPNSYLQIIQQSRGLVLLTGATGSGKTTTLAATLEHLNDTVDGHIITLEDPVEYLIRSRRCLVDQRQVGRDVMSFHDGLRSALRQDPDILLVGELRDFETVKTALDAANTGHLVFGTLHTNSAQQSIERVASFFSDSNRDWAYAVLSQALLGIVSQVLVPRASEPGRVLAAEILVNTPDVRQVIREGRTHQLLNAMDTGSSKGQVVLNKVLKELVQRKTVAIEAALYASYDPTSLKKELQRG